MVSHDLLILVPQEGLSGQREKSVLALPPARLGGCPSPLRCHCILSVASMDLLIMQGGEVSAGIAGRHCRKHRYDRAVEGHCRGRQCSAYHHLGEYGFPLRSEAIWDMMDETRQRANSQGMPGIGKTTSIHCLAHALLGDAYKEGVLELNASDERCVLFDRGKSHS